MLATQSSALSGKDPFAQAGNAYWVLLRGRAHRYWVLVAKTLNDVGHGGSRAQLSVELGGNAVGSC